MNQLTQAVEVVGRDDITATHAVRAESGKTYCGRPVAVIGDETTIASTITCGSCRIALANAGLLAEPTPHMPGPDDMSDAPKDSQVKLTTNTSKYNETCTAVELTAGGSMACLIFQDAEGHVILQVNTTYYADGAVICDVIDVERQYDDKRALVDPASARRSVVPFTYLVSADMRHAS